ncbi:MAG: glycogen/starch/alpha-glucan phosphorylase, partial [Gemmiger sp.]|uniref:glycogen/starch/alpha-glucan phosphorylase n=1 Tax=Gemmiger sp. TaxID=2049027 RepID=UPI002A90FDD0
SMEFLMGRFFGNSLINLEMYDEVKEVLEELGIDYNMVEDAEPDPGLGNGGLGRLAACFLDSLSTLQLPAYGCGIRYHYGIFEQKIENGYQVEAPDNWLENGDPWGIKRNEYAVEVKFGGNVRAVPKGNGEYRFVQENYQSVIAVPYDYPVIGYGNNTVNTLRLWEARAKNKLDLKFFNEGNYQKAAEEELLASTMTDVLYPADEHIQGKELRLRQQYFFISATVQRVVERFKKNHTDFHKLPDKVAFQLNDTHPTVAVAELMRVLVDENDVPWDDAWEITRKVCAYTNHTIMAEALEKWPMELFSRLLPRIYQIVEEINRRYCLELQARYGMDPEKLRHMAIIADGQIRMAYLAIVGSHSVNGVAALHTEILKNQELKDFYELYPEKFNNKTNGITFRRWLLECDPALTSLIEELIGSGFRKDAAELEKLLKYTDDIDTLQRFSQVKADNKRALAAWLAHTQGVTVNTDAMFDIQSKRLHEYKRQQLNLLYLIHQYYEIKAGHTPATPLVSIFGAKAAPAYIIAKDIIHALLTLSKVIAADPAVSPWLQIVFVENYNVTAAEKLIPACDLSEQISLASKEASGTGNMKFMLNGALTLGTMDGANVEISQQVGGENCYIFGQTSDQVIHRYAAGDYCAAQWYEGDPNIRRAIDFLTGPEMLAAGRAENLQRLHDELVNKDWFQTLPDFNAYVVRKGQALADYAYDPLGWRRKCLVNIAKAGMFSSDRTIAEYNQDIWHLG